MSPFLPTPALSYNQQRLELWRRELLYARELLFVMRITQGEPRRLALHTKYFYLALDKVWELQQAVEKEQHR
jgi:hypothetical protein